MLVIRGDHVGHLRNSPRVLSRPTLSPLLENQKLCEPDREPSLFALHLILGAVKEVLKA